MHIKLANNAIGHLAASLASTDTTVVLDPAEAGNFPSLSAGEWHPMTIIADTGAFEIVKVTARSSNILTVQRGAEATTAMNFLAGARAEVRMTAAVVQTLQDDLTTAKASIAIDIASGDTATAAQVTTSLTTDLTALMIAKDTALGTSLTGTMDTKDNALATTLRAEIAAAIAAMPSAFVTGFGPLPWSRSSPPSGWIWADGSILASTTPYTALRTAYINDGFPFGQDGSGNPKVPDMRGVAPVGLDNLGGTAAGRLSGATTMGTLLGSQTHTLTTAQLPAHSHTASSAAAGGHTPTGSLSTVADHDHAGSTTDTEPAHTHNATAYGTGSGAVIGNGATAIQNTARATTSAGAHSHAVTVVPAGGHTHTLTMGAVTDHTHAITVANAGTGDPHPNVQPSLALGYIIKT